MPSRRLLRVAAILKEEIGKIITHELADPAIGFVTITEVRPAPDLRTARVYVSILGDEEAQERSMRALEHARRHIQAETASRVSLRLFPTLAFSLDDRIKKSIRISQLLNMASEEHNAGDNDGE